MSFSTRALVEIPAFKEDKVPNESTSGTDQEDLWGEGDVGMSRDEDELSVNVATSS